MKLQELLSKNEDIDYLESLTAIQLNFDENIDQIDNDYLLNLSSTISACINLEELILQYGFIGTQRELNYSVLFEVFEKLSKLKKLDLDFNYIGNLKDDNIQAFANFIATSNLTYLSLVDNDLGSLNYNNLEKIFIALPKCKNLKYLYILADNDLNSNDDYTFNMIHQCFISCPNLINLECFTPYLSKEREEKVSTIRSVIATRINFNNNQILTKYFCNVVNSSQNNVINNKELNSNLQKTYLLEEDNCQENKGGNNFFSKFKFLNCTIM